MHTLTDMLSRNDKHFKLHIRK